MLPYDSGTKRELEDLSLYRRPGFRLSVDGVPPVVADHRGIYHSMRRARDPPGQSRTPAAALGGDRRAGANI